MKTKLSLIAIILFGFICFQNVAVAQQKVERWSRFEVVLNHSNPEQSFSAVKLSARFFNKDTSFVVSGFYDGNNLYKLRFMPNETGIWSYTTSSNIPALNNKKGSFECIMASGKNHGMVKVSDTYNFKYADGKRYYPFGTTAYAWNHMGADLQKITLNSLKNSGFNKVRMCVFPKNYDLVKEEPEIYPYAVKEVKKDAQGKEVKIWDFKKFNPVFFQRLEEQIDALENLGIQADLILFHPYDKGRWGFDAMPNDFNIKYIEYLTARLASFRNIWWSMANEWDLVKSKTHSDWELLSKTVYQSDPYRHLCSIHGSTAKYYEYWEPWFTHVSIQDESPVMNWGAAAILRCAYYKPVIYDEVGYEGNLKQRWGRYSPEEMTYLVWMGVIAGTYVTHGEAYLFKDDRDTIFWAKGRSFKGSSWKRIAFLRNIVEQCPNPLQMADLGRDHRTSTAGNGYYIIYLGKECNDSWQFNLPAKNAGYERLKEGKRFKVEIVDTWDMTIQTCPMTFETTDVIDYRVYDKEMKRVRLPLKPYLALRITEIPK
jgi:Domain of unknown function (DUF5605)/Domain of unknown function (DUF5060)/Protein of unknown function (DUF4038)